MPNRHDIAEAWRLYKDDGDSQARDRLILAYSPLVKYVAGRMSSGSPGAHRGGRSCLVRSAGPDRRLERFDLSRNIKFETYAVPRIKGVHHRRVAGAGLGAALRSELGPQGGGGGDPAGEHS